ncbi:hypothetical protein RJ639_013763 [Escallonia herrerae]|uniref:Uncharacterized protein n=1 Tax=Escallonia herrerae TaxID=1293975 RepID=A0AA88VGT6_9ASTE|nr:hypothetical protein RJ639_013763 [Escallonia herrerae]
MKGEASETELWYKLNDMAYPDSPLGPDAYQEYESLLVQDYEELIKRHEMTSRQSGYRELKENLTPEDEGWLKLTAGEEYVSHARDLPNPQMDLKLEIYSLGDLSKTVGKLLTDMSSLYDVGRCRRSAGLLLINRTLDLLTPSSHGDSLVDSIFSSLPCREHTTLSSQIKGSQTQLKHRPVKLNWAPLDVQIPIAKILSEEDSTTTNFQVLESVEAFLRGWDSSDPADQMSVLINFSPNRNSDISLGNWAIYSGQSGKLR